MRSVTAASPVPAARPRARPRRALRRTPRRPRRARSAGRRRPSACRGPGRAPGGSAHTGFCAGGQGHMEGRRWMRSRWSMMTSPSWRGSTLRGRSAATSASDRVRSSYSARTSGSVRLPGTSSALSSQSAPFPAVPAAATAGAADFRVTRRRAARKKTRRAETAGARGRGARCRRSCGHPLPRPGGNAGAALTVALGADVGVPGRVRVTLRTVGLEGVEDRWARSAQDIDTIRHGLKVRRVQAVAHPAQVIDDQTWRDGPKRQLVADAMDSAFTAAAAAVHIYAPVAVVLKVSGSTPSSRFPS